MEINVLRARIILTNIMEGAQGLLLGCNKILWLTWCWSQGCPLRWNLGAGNATVLESAGPIPGCLDSLAAPSLRLCEPGHTLTSTIFTLINTTRWTAFVGHAVFLLFTVAWFHWVEINIFHDTEEKLYASWFPQRSLHIFHLLKVNMLLIKYVMWLQYHFFFKFLAFLPQCQYSWNVCEHRVFAQEDTAQ